MVVESRYPHLVVDEQGQLKIEATRLKVRLLVEAHNSGLSPEQLRDEFDFLTLAQIHSALAYYYDHQSEVDAQIAEARYDAERLRDTFESQTVALREKLSRKGS